MVVRICAPQTVQLTPLSETVELGSSWSDSVIGQGDRSIPDMTAALQAMAARHHFHALIKGALIPQWLADEWAINSSASNQLSGELDNRISRQSLFHHCCY